MNGDTSTEAPSEKANDLKNLDPTQGEDTQWPDEAKVMPDAYLDSKNKT